jgi:NitT/TauT family transport system permease protein
VTAATGPDLVAGGRLPSVSVLAGRLVRYVPAILVFVAILVIWEVYTGGEGRRVIPPPSSIWAAAMKNADTLRDSAANTFWEAIGGLVIGAAAGIIIGFASARWALARDILLPVAIGASTIPLIAIAPIINNWFGITNSLSKMMMAALLVFFPIVINVTRGLVQVQPSALELMRSYAASDPEILRKVRIPNMLPFLFTALKVSTTLAFIGALVGEYFGGSSEVLGRIVLTSMSSGSFALAWAGIILGAIGAIVAYMVVSILERLLIPWYAALRAGEI